MTTQLKDVALKLLPFVGGAAVVALALLIPGILVFKLLHGASVLTCFGILAGYVAAWIVGLLGIIRFGTHEAVWGTAFGLCFLALLFLSWRL